MSKSFSTATFLGPHNTCIVSLNLQNFTVVISLLRDFTNVTKMISASPVEQGTLALFPAGWEIEAHTGLNDLLTGTKALVRSPVPSLLLRDLRHTQSKEEEEVTHNLLGVVSEPSVPAHVSVLDPRIPPQPLDLSLCRTRNTRKRSELKSSTAGKARKCFKSQRNLPEASHVTVLICRTVVSPCSSS